ncbi:MAG: Do family serine endopeptidase [Tannerellaceae bacterium]|nr:Do family serine endopeptidase [Tannerellaceae bacterium]
MKTVLKNVLGVVLVAAISAGAAIGTSTYIMNKKQAESSYSIESDYGFKQPVHFANYNAVAPETIDFTVIAEKAVNAVVHIKSVTKAQASNPQQQYIDPFEFFFGNRGNRQQQLQPRVGFGSGVIISTDGYIITNNHVIDGADEIEVTMNNNRKYSAKIIGTDPSTDIALLKIDETNLSVIPFGDSEKLKVGEWVLAIGNPFNLNSTVTAGIVSATGRSVMTGRDDVSRVASFIQTDAAVNPGNSGGALINTRGELVGINTLIYSETGNFAGYSFAVPISIAGKVVSDLREFGTVQRALLGVTIADIQNVPEEERNKLKVLEGAYVADFGTRSSAKEAGMEVGDVITAVNGTRVRSVSALQEQISKYRPGEKVSVEVDRKGSTKNFTVELRNAQGNTDVIQSKGDAADVLGAAFKELSAEQKRSLGISYGIEVTSVTNGKFKEHGVPKGYIIMQVNNQRINSIDDFEKIVERLLKSNGQEQVLIIRGITPSGRTRHYAIDLVD